MTDTLADYLYPDYYICSSAFKHNLHLEIMHKNML